MLEQELRETSQAVSLPCVTGSFVECGVWRGGTSIYAAAVLKAHAAFHRQVVLVDSFQGLPRASSNKDTDIWSTMDFLMIPHEQVKAKFNDLQLLSSNIVFEKGFFNESCPRLRMKMQALRASQPSSHGGNIAVLRMDGDMYESTMDILFNLYELVPVGGYVIVDDYYSVQAAQNALREFLKIHNTTAAFVDIDKDAVYWKKTEVLQLNQTWYKEFNKRRKPRRRSLLQEVEPVKGGLMDRWHWALDRLRLRL